MEQYINGLVLVGVPAIVLVPLLIEWLKQTFKLPTSLTGVAASVLGLIVAFGVQSVKTWPTIEPWVTMVVSGILLGLAANGAYSQYQKFKTTRAQDNQENPNVPK